MQMTHTPAPWRIIDKGNGYYIIAVGSETYPQRILTLDVERTSEEIGAANAARVVTCVNALEGMDPNYIPQVIPALRHAIEIAQRTDLPASVNHFQTLLFSLTGSRE